MKRFILGLAIVPTILVGSVVVAQDADKMPQAGDPVGAADNVTQTEDMWFYLQELRRYDDPKMAVRRKAELKSRQRRQRLAAMKWYGYSQSRPMANPIPVMGYYSPMWAGNGSDPYLWIGNAYVTTAVRVETVKAASTTRR